jgi:hypothetical protein
VEETRERAPVEEQIFAQRPSISLCEEGVDGADERRLVAAGELVQRLDAPEEAAVQDVTVTLRLLEPSSSSAEALRALARPASMAAWMRASPFS